MSATGNITLANLRSLPDALAAYLFKYRGTARDAWGLKIFFSLPLEAQWNVLVQLRNLEDATI